MREWFYLITDDRDEDVVGNVISRESRYTGAEKNTETPIQYFNLETDERRTRQVVSLGYADFEDAADKEENILDTMRSKLLEIDECHLDKVGIDPSGWQDGDPA